MALPLTSVQPDPSVAPAARAVARDFLLARLGSLFAILPLGVWTVNHLWNQLAAYNGPVAWQSAVEGHQGAVGATVTFVIVLGPLLWHTLWGISRMVRSRPVVDVSRFSNVRYWVQRLSAVGLILFLGAHLWLAWFHPRFIEGAPEAFIDISHEMHFNGPTLAVYLLGTLAIAYHLANGLWSFSMGWGLTVSKSGLAWMERISMIVFLALLVLGWGAVYALYQAAVNT